MNTLRTNIRVAELAGIGTRIAAYYDDLEELQSDEFLAQIVSEVDQIAQDMTTAYNQTHVRSERRQADAARDEAVRNLSALIEGYTAIPIEAMQTAALKLKQVFDKFGLKIVSMNYAVASVNINALLEDLSDESLSASIAALEGMAEAIEALRSAQDAFNAADLAYTNAVTNKAATPYSYRPSLLKAINEKLVPFLSSAVLVFPDKYGLLANNVQMAIDAANTTTKKRSNKVQSSKFKVQSEETSDNVQSEELSETDDETDAETETNNDTETDTETDTNPDTG